MNNIPGNINSSSYFVSNSTHNNASQIDPQIPWLVPAGDISFSPLMTPLTITHIMKTGYPSSFPNPFSPFSYQYFPQQLATRQVDVSSGVKQPEFFTFDNPQINFNGVSGVAAPAEVAAAIPGLIPFPSVTPHPLNELIRYPLLPTPTGSLPAKYTQHPLKEWHPDKTSVISPVQPKPESPTGQTDLEQANIDKKMPVINEVVTPETPAVGVTINPHIAGSSSSKKKPKMSLYVDTQLGDLPTDLINFSAENQKRLESLNASDHANLNPDSSRQPETKSSKSNKKIPSLQVLTECFSSDIDHNQAMPLKIAGYTSFEILPQLDSPGKTVKKKRKRASNSQPKAREEETDKQMKRKYCKFAGCQKIDKGGGFCKSHGGGRRCKVESCFRSSRGSSGLCIAHGGGPKCTFIGCTKSARKVGGYCKGHGGGKRCKEPDCTKAAREPADFCIRHGGGLRCMQEGCNSSVRVSKSLCKKHQNEKENQNIEILPDAPCN